MSGLAISASRHWAGVRRPLLTATSPRSPIPSTSPLVDDAQRLPRTPREPSIQISSPHVAATNGAPDEAFGQMDKFPRRIRGHERWLHLVRLALLKTVRRPLILVTALRSRFRHSNVEGAGWILNRLSAASTRAMPDHGAVQPPDTPSTTSPGQHRTVSVSLSCSNRMTATRGRLLAGRGPRETVRRRLLEALYCWLLCVVARCLSADGHSQRQLRLTGIPA